MTVSEAVRLCTLEYENRRLIAFDQTRGWWLLRHPHASPCWLRGVRAVAGEAVFDKALDHLTILHDDDPDYHIERAHMANAVQVLWNAGRRYRKRV